MAKQLFLALAALAAISFGAPLFSAENEKGAKPEVSENQRAADAPSSNENKSLETLQEDFLKLKFGMFLHFNLETFKGAQWLAGYHDPSTFNPQVKTIDTDAWADAAVAAKMKYGVLTVKHTSGFCLWDSKYTTYDVMNPKCPYQKDLVAQFVKSFTSRGLKAGLYYCWRHPNFGSPEKYKLYPPECDPSTHSLKEQNEFALKQIEELVKNYPDVFYIWNDTLDPVVIPAEELVPQLRVLRPGVLYSANWWDWDKKGKPYADIVMTERFHFPEGNTLPGETCWTLEQTWFWRNNFKPKDAKDIVQQLAIANSRHANFLLNVAPNKKGNLSKASIKTLKEIGDLLNTSEKD